MKNKYIALILAAGFGNRMMPLTKKNHKTLLDVGGETILARIINSLEQESITEIYIVTGYKKKQIKDFLNF